MLKVPDLIQLPERRSTLPVSTAHRCAYIPIVPFHVVSGRFKHTDRLNAHFLSAGRHRRLAEIHLFRSESEIHQERT
jgi:hypothetical protein